MTKTGWVVVVVKSRKAPQWLVLVKHTACVWVNHVSQFYPHGCNFCQEEWCMHAHFAHCAKGESQRAAKSCLLFYCYIVYCLLDRLFAFWRQELEMVVQRWEQVNDEADAFVRRKKNRKRTAVAKALTKSFQASQEAFLLLTVVRPLPRTQPLITPTLTCPYVFTFLFLNLYRHLFSSVLLFPLDKNPPTINYDDGPWRYILRKKYIHGVRFDRGNRK